MKVWISVIIPLLLLCTFLQGALGSDRDVNFETAYAKLAGVWCDTDQLFKEMKASLVLYNQFATVTLKYGDPSTYIDDDASLLERVFQAVFSLDEMFRGFVIFCGQAMSLVVTLIIDFLRLFVLQFSFIIQMIEVFFYCIL